MVMANTAAHKPKNKEKYHGTRKTCTPRSCLRSQTDRKSRFRLHTPNTLNLRIRRRSRICSSLLSARMVESILATVSHWSQQPMAHTLKYSHRWLFLSTATYGISEFHASSSGWGVGSTSSKILHMPLDSPSQTVLPGWTQRFPQPAGAPDPPGGIQPAASTGHFMINGTVYAPSAGVGQAPSDGQGKVNGT